MQVKSESSREGGATRTERAFTSAQRDAVADGFAVRKWSHRGRRVDWRDKVPEECPRGVGMRAARRATFAF